MSDTLEELLAAYLERRESGAGESAEEFARAHPAHEHELREALRRLGLLERRLDALGASPLRIGRYQVLGELARGGMGRVLRARDPERPERPVALKLLDGIGALSTRGRERFRREAQILAGIEHEGVVGVLEAGVDEAVPWIAMELVEGESLAAVLARRGTAGAGCSEPTRPFTPRQAAAVAARLARGVEAVHAAGVLHRDIKPANVILTAQGRVVLVDFGLVREEGTATLTRTGDLLGTPQYMAPEQARGERADERSDVYGLGAVLYQLLALRPPHGGAGASDPVQILAEARTRSAPALSRHAPQTPRELERIAMRALAFRRSRRTQTAAAFARDLEDFLAGRPVLARPASLLERADEAWRVHGRKLPALAGLILLAAGGVALARELGSRAEARERVLVENVLGRWLARDEEGLRRASALLVEERPKQRFASLLEALARGEELPDAADPLLAAVARGWNASRASRHDEALAALQEAAALEPRELVPGLLLARAAELAERRELAAREYRAAIEKSPERAELHARLSAVHWALRDEAEAERAIRRAIELAPREGAHRFALARILGRLKRHEEGLEAALAGAELAGESATRLELQILSAMLDQAKRHLEAREVLRKVLARWPGDAQALYNLAYSYMLDHHLSEAVETLHELARTKDRSKALASLAWIHAGSDRESCEECRASYAREPSLLDAARAEEQILEALERNDSDEVPTLAVRIAKLLGRREKIAALLQALKDKEEDDLRIARLERSLRLLRD